MLLRSRTLIDTANAAIPRPFSQPDVGDAIAFRDSHEAFAEGIILPWSVRLRRSIFRAETLRHEMLSSGSDGRAL